MTVNLEQPNSHVQKPINRVLLLGNMNNNFFSYYRYLLDLGIQAKLIVFADEPSHFRPVEDTFYIEKYENDILYLSLGTPHTLNLNGLKSLFKFIKEFKPDLTIGSHYAPFYLKLIGSKCNIFIPYGSDLYELPFSRTFIQTSFFKKVVLTVINNCFIAPFQKRAIQMSDAVIIIDNIITYRQALGKLSVKHFRLGSPIVYNFQCLEDNVEDYPDDISILLRNVSAQTFVVFSQSRQYWTQSVDGATFEDIKANDRLIHAFANFALDKTDVILILFKYGPDVVASQQLVAELGIEESVIWMPKMSRKYILRLLNEFASLGADQFTAGYFGGTGYEIMSQGIPLLVNLNIPVAEYETLIGSPYPPILNAQSSSDILEHLEYYYMNREELKALRLITKSYFDKYLGKGLVNKHIALFQSLPK